MSLIRNYIENKLKQSSGEKEGLLSEYETNYMTKDSSSYLSDVFSVNNQEKLPISLHLVNEELFFFPETQAMCVEGVLAFDKNFFTHSKLIVTLSGYMRMSHHLATMQIFNSTTVFYKKKLCVYKNSHPVFCEIESQESMSKLPIPGDYETLCSFSFQIDRNLPDSSKMRDFDASYVFEYILTVKEAFKYTTYFKVPIYKHAFHRQKQLMPIPANCCKIKNGMYFKKGLCCLIICDKNHCTFDDTLNISVKILNLTSLIIKKISLSLCQFVDISYIDRPKSSTLQKKVLATNIKADQITNFKAQLNLMDKLDDCHALKISLKNKENQIFESTSLYNKTKTWPRVFFQVTYYIQVKFTVLLKSVFFRVPIDIQLDGRSMDGAYGKDGL